MAQTLSHYAGKGRTVERSQRILEYQMRILGSREALRDAREAGDDRLVDLARFRWTTACLALTSLTLAGAAAIPS
jgi:hypothetical protein